MCGPDAIVKSNKKPTPKKPTPKKKAAGKRPAVSSPNNHTD
jgi:hypothetical protein